jgi:hypothetical protein
MARIHAYLKARPIVRRASQTHRQIRRFGDVYLIMPDGRWAPSTQPTSTCRSLERALELARRAR